MPGMNEKKALTASLHGITLVTADWYGSDSSWLISQLKIIETMKLGTKIAFDFLKFSEASEQQRIKHSQRSKLFITIQFIPLKGGAVFPWKPPNFVILPAAPKGPVII